MALTATYRLQLGAAFTFAHARAQVPYFDRLGVSHLYLSPILAARRGSTHGYDVVDPCRVDHALGGEAGLRDLARELAEHEMSLIVDIVPNHMGTGEENAYWDDVLARGERSRHAHWFDIDWASRGAKHKVVLPVLDDEQDRVLERGELSVRVRDGHSPRIVYGAQSFPVDDALLPVELQLATFDPGETAELTAAFSGSAGRDRLRALLDVQHYRLVHWRTGAAEINYRRFFDVNDLVALRVDDERVFDETHALIVRLVNEGIINGLRVDHVDGLRDPRRYLERLRAVVPPATPIVVEKILSGQETLPRSWPVDGTTGYEFLNDLDDLFLEPTGLALIEDNYRCTRRLGSTTFRDVALDAKAAFVAGAMRPDLDRLKALLAPLARAAAEHWTDGELAAGLVSFIAALPVYRTYVARGGERLSIEPTDRDAVRAALDVVRPHALPAAPVAEFVGRVVIGDVEGLDPAATLCFVERLQQLTGSAAARGVEDTALYIYMPLVSRNEVGGGPDRPIDDAVARFHERAARRGDSWPLGLTCTATHDTKHSGDVRARLSALTEMPQEWQRAVHRWRRLNAKHRRVVNGRIAPDTNAEYLLYQTIVALWPPPRLGRRADDLPDRTWRDAVRARLTEYMRKAAREAKTRTSWVEPNANYEIALDDFVDAVLEPREDAPFLSDVARLVANIAAAGARTSLSRIALHLTAPGTPDIYQGDDMWNFTLVDPDNRRPVDYDARAAAFDDMAALDEQLRAGHDVDPFDQRLKLLVTHRLLMLRRANAALFARGDYRPLRARGARATHVIAFARSHGDRSVITVASRWTNSWSHASAADWWADTAVELPDELVGRAWHSQITDSDVVAPDNALGLSPLLRTLPLTVVVA